MSFFSNLVKILMHDEKREKGNWKDFSCREKILKFSYKKCDRKRKHGKGKGKETFCVVMYIAQVFRKTIYKMIFKTFPGNF